MNEAAPFFYNDVSDVKRIESVRGVPVLDVH